MKHRHQVGIFLLLGAATSVAVAWAVALDGPGWAKRYRTASVGGGPGAWGVSVWSSTGWTVVHRGPHAVQAWAPAQATGAPDTPGAGDIRTAWASASRDDQVEWLRLRYAKAVRPAAVEIHETYNPGAVIEVSVFDAAGDEHVAWSGTDPTPTTAARGVSTIPIDADGPVRELRVALDSPAVPGWNEIDAVALVDHNGARQWAIDVTASSTFASGQAGVTGRDPGALIPRWSSIDLARGDPAEAQRVEIATGWPLRAMRATVPAVAPGTMRGAGAVASLLALNPMSVPVGSTFPLRPIPTGLLVNTLAGAAAWWGLVAAVRPLRTLRPTRVLREMWRTRQGQCAACGFDLRYDLARGCPECGWRRAPDEPARADVADASRT